LALALGVAHAAEIVHRDLKPSNVLIRPDGTPVLVDLGIVAVGSGPRLTQTGSLIGTPSYMSPDQVRGEELDGRSDIYSLGIILYEMLTGRRPFEAEEPVAVLHKQVYEEPVLVRKRRPELSKATAELVQKCMRKERGERYGTAREVVEGIDEALQAEGATGPNPQATQVLTHLHDSALISRQRVLHVPTVERRRRRTVPIWVIATVVTVVAALALVYLLRQNGDEPGTPVTEVAGVIQAAPTEAITVAANETVEGEIPPLPSPTETPLPTSTQEPTATATPEPLPSRTDIPTPALPILQNKVVFQSNRDGDFEIYVMNSDGFDQIQLTNNAIDDNYPVVSLQGNQVVFESYRDGNWEVYAMNLDGTNQRRLTYSPNSNDRLPTWSPDGNEIAFISDRDGDYDIYIVGAEGSNVRQVTFTDIREGHVSWSVDGRLVYNAGPGDGKTWEIYTIDTNGQNLERLTNNNVSDWAPEWSPDGRMILYLSIVGSNDPAIFTMNADGSNQRLLYNSEAYEWGADWTADGSRILFTKDDGDFSNLYIMNADGTDVQFLTARGGYPSWAR
jgi:TolB protein